jgi:hypothetical protein
VDLKQIFNTSSPVIGVVHLLPLPSSPRWGGDLKAVIQRAEQEATALAAGGVDGIIVENFFDAPFAKLNVDPVIISTITLIVDRIQNLVVLPIGINLLRNDSLGAMAIASTVNANFIRVNVHSGVMATDQGIIEGRAYELLKYRRELGSKVAIFADVLVKHASSLGNPELANAVRDTFERGLADAVILSGASTGQPPSALELEIAQSAAKGEPVFIGSGADCDNIGNLIKFADGIIVASSLKRNNQISEPVDPIKVAQFIEAVRFSH